MPTVPTDDGAALWMATTGSGPGLVLCHGGPGSFDTLEPVARLVDDRFSVHRWDQRGSGRSTIAGPFTIARFVADLESLRASSGHDRWIVGGHSWGANLALHYALAHPARTRALLYLNGTGLAWPAWKPAYRAERESRLTPDELARFHALKPIRRTPAEEREFLILNDIPNYGDPADARRLAERNLEASLAYPVSWAANAALNRESDALDEADLIRRCGTLTMPVLVLTGGRDPRPATAIVSLVAALPHPVRVDIPRVGHEPWVEAPDALRQALLGFLDSLSVR